MDTCDKELKEMPFAKGVWICKNHGVVEDIDVAHHCIRCGELVQWWEDLACSEPKHDSGCLRCPHAAHVEACQNFCGCFMPADGVQAVELTETDDWKVVGPIEQPTPAAEQAIDWRKFVPVEEIPSATAPPEGSFDVNKGAVIASWSTLSRGGHIIGIGSVRVSIGHSDVDEFGGGAVLAGDKLWSGNRIRLIRHANGRWADGFHPGGPCKPGCGRVTSYAARGDIGCESEPCFFLHRGRETYHYCSEFCRDRAKAKAAADRASSPAAPVVERVRTESVCDLCDKSTPASEVGRASGPPENFWACDECAKAMDDRKAAEATDVEPSGKTGELPEALNERMLSYLRDRKPSAKYPVPDGYVVVAKRWIERTADEVAALEAKLATAERERDEVRAALMDARLQAMRAST